MSEKDLVYQVLNREISNILGTFGGSFRLFAPTITNYIINLVEPYINAFSGVDGKINTKAATAFLKEETSNKIEELMKKFEAEQNGSV